MAGFFDFLPRGLLQKPTQVSPEEIAQAMEWKKSLMSGYLGPQTELTDRQREADRQAAWASGAGFNPQEIRDRGGLLGMASTPGTYDQAMMMGGLAPLGITAFHGSPHKFDSFKMEKIGTGEGAQAYGHGLYFAENPGVAKNYAQTLGGSKWVTVDPSVDKKVAELIPEAMKAHEKNPESAARMLLAKAAEFDDVIARGDGSAIDFTLSDRYKSAADAVLSGKAKVSMPNLYKVDLPDEQVAKFLDWDKPLSQQPDVVQKALGVPSLSTLEASRDSLLKELVAMEKAGTQMTKEGSAIRGQLDQIANTINRWHVGDQSGQAIYQRLSLELGGLPKASDTLRQLGIPGIRYLDQGSRAFAPPRIENSAGGHTVYWGNDPRPVGTYKTLAEAQKAAMELDTRTSNFVVFDENLPKILERK